MAKTRLRTSALHLCSLLLISSLILISAPLVQAESEVVPKYPGSTEDSAQSTQDAQASNNLPTAPDGSTEASNQILSPKTGVVSVGVVIFVIAASGIGILYDRRRLSRIEAQKSEK